MSIRDSTSYKQQLLAQRATLLGQLASLRGGPVGRAESSATHFGEREPDSRAQMESERGLEFTLDARERAELDAAWQAFERSCMNVHDNDRSDRSAPAKRRRLRGKQPRPDGF